MEKKLKSSISLNTRQLAVIGMLSAISIFLGMSGLGFIPIPPVKATIMHVPVIIGAILEGPLVGAMIGLIFGLFSVVNAMANPMPLSFAFMNPAVSILPRVIIGITTYYCYSALSSRFGTIKVALGAAIGSLTNTFGVLGMLYLIYIERYAGVYNISVSAARKGIIAVAFTNGIPEAILSVLITIPVVMAVRKTRK